MVLLDTGTPGTSREITVRMPMVGLELATVLLEREVNHSWEMVTI